jgi:hypothetical protein
MGCRLFDCMGIEHTKTDGILLDDLMFLIKGHIKKGYKASTIHFNRDINDAQLHGNCCIIIYGKANKISL